MGGMGGDGWVRSRLAAGRGSGDGSSTAGRHWTTAAAAAWWQRRAAAAASGGAEVAAPRRGAGGTLGRWRRARPCRWCPGVPRGAAGGRAAGGHGRDRSWGRSWGWAAPGGGMEAACGSEQRSPFRQAAWRSPARRTTATATAACAAQQLQPQPQPHAFDVPNSHLPDSGPEANLTWPVSLALQPTDQTTNQPTKVTTKQTQTGEFEIVIVTELKPQDNTLLEGLYKSSGNYCTQVRAVGIVTLWFRPFWGREGRVFNNRTERDPPSRRGD